MPKVVELIVLQLTPGEKTKIVANVQVKEDSVPEILELLEDNSL